MTAPKRGKRKPKKLDCGRYFMFASDPEDIVLTERMPEGTKTVTLFFGTKEIQKAAKFFNQAVEWANRKGRR